MNNKLKTRYASWKVQNVKETGLPRRDKEKSKWISSSWLGAHPISFRTRLDQMCLKQAEAALALSTNTCSLNGVRCRMWQKVEMETIQTVPTQRDTELCNGKRELFQHTTSKFCSLTTCKHLTANSPSLSLAWFQMMPTHKTSHIQSKSHCSLELARTQPPCGANLWKTLRPLKNVTMVSETERNRGRERKQTNTLYSPWALSRQTSQMLNGTQCLAFGCCCCCWDYFLLLVSCEKQLV